MNAIQVDRLSKAFSGRSVLRDLDLSIPRGSIYGLLGRNAAGKTTLLRILMGLIHPDCGESRVLGNDLLRGGRAEKDRVAYVAQGEFLPPGASVRDIVRLDAGLRTEWDPSALERWLGDEGIDPGREIATLSGGQRKRLELELALAARPSVLLLDEPLVGLDPVSRTEFIEQLMGFAAEHTPTILLSSHMVGDLERICDRVGILARAAIGFESTVDELKAESNEGLEEITVKLMRALEAEEAEQ